MHKNVSWKTIFGELFPCLLFVSAVALFLIGCYWDSKVVYRLDSVVGFCWVLVARCLFYLIVWPLNFVLSALFLGLVCFNIRRHDGKEWKRRLLVLGSVLGGAFAGWYCCPESGMFVMGIIVTVMAISLFLCIVNIFFLQWRGNRTIVLLIFLLAFGVGIYQVAGLCTEGAVHDKTKLVEPIHVINQLVGVELPNRWKLEQESGIGIACLFELYHLTVWLVVVALALSLGSREFLNRLYLKLTQIKPLYILWGVPKKGDNREFVARSLRRGESPLFEPNVVVAIFGPEKEGAVDICDSWGWTWIEASTEKKDRIAFYATEHYLLSQDGMANVKDAISLFSQKAQGKIYVRVDSVPNNVLWAFRKFGIGQIYDFTERACRRVFEGEKFGIGQIYDFTEDKLRKENEAQKCPSKVLKINLENKQGVTEFENWIGNNADGRDLFISSFKIGLLFSKIDSLKVGKNGCKIFVSVPDRKVQQLLTVVGSKVEWVGSFEDIYNADLIRKVSSSHSPDEVGETENGGQVMGKRGRRRVMGERGRVRRRRRRRRRRN